MKWQPPPRQRDEWALGKHLVIALEASATCGIPKTTDRGLRSQKKGPSDHSMIQVINDYFSIATYGDSGIHHF